MALTLESLLASAQNAQSRRPIVEIISGEAIAAIPFDGQLLTTETTDETGVNNITHSSGRIAAVYTESSNEIHFVYTSTDRTELTNISLYTSAQINAVGLCELQDGNIGIIILDTVGTDYRLRSMIVSVLGDIVSAAQTIGTWATSGQITRSPFPVALM